MTVFQFISKVFNNIKFSALMTFFLFGLSVAFKNLIHYYISRLFGFIAENPTEILSVTSLTFVAIYAGLNFGSNIADGIRTVFEYRTTVFLKKNILTTLFKQVHKHSSNYFATEQSGAIAQKIFSISGCVNAFCWQIKGLLEGFLIPNVIGFSILFSVNTSMGITVFIFFTIALIVNYYHCRCLKPLSKIASSLESKAAGIMVDSIANIRIVKNCSAIKHERTTLAKALNKYTHKKIDIAKEKGISNCYNILSMSVLKTISMGIVIYYWYVKNFNITDIFLSIAYINTVIASVERFGNFAVDNIRRYSILQTHLNTLYRPFDIENSPTAQKLEIKKPSIVFDNIKFSYTKDKEIFKNFNLTIKPKEKLGIVGLSGSGKSTLIKLILRAYDVSEGKITISDQNIKDITLHSLHQNIALISQEPCLFNRSIMDNIRFAKPKATDEEVYKAAKLAYIHDTILKLPYGYDSIVGERCIKLSGGERQRIAIAAALLKDAPILILDEATSALDSESEIAIQKALKNIMKNKTVIAIAHRLSTLNHMNRIIVLDNQKIVEDNTPKELLKNEKGLFHHLYTLQSEGLISS